MAAPPSGGQAGIRFAVRALSHRNYRLFFFGQGTSLIGTWLTRVATSWLVYRLSGSAWLLGVVGFCGQIPTSLLAPLGGLFGDRHDRHRILLVTQALSMLQSFALAALALSGGIRVWHVAVLQIVQGIINAFDTPARQAFLVEMVQKREDLPNAIALNSSVFNGARLVGPSVAGVLIALVGEGGCFLIDGISYLAVLGSLLAMQLGPRPLPKAHAPAREALREGFDYAMGFAPVRALLTLLAVTGLMGMPYTVLMPAMARDVLHGSARTLGFLMASVGVGALAAALWLASRRTVVGLGRVLITAAGLFGLLLVAFSFSRSVPLSIALLALAGFCFMVQTASTNTILQTIVDERLRSRLMSFYTMSFMGTAPLGSLLAGALAEAIGVSWTIAVGGLCCAIAAAYFARRLPALQRLVRPIYTRLGILPEVAEGLQAGERAGSDG